ncbi:MAG: hypothetical protein KAI66_28220, partial [Lentisphaeria bacterium]|nr:hypothetical protein [Lentisphaeria bacterium]
TWTVSLLFTVGLAYGSALGEAGETARSQSCIVVDAHGKAVVEGWLICHVEGAHVNHKRWFNTQEPVSGCEFLEFASCAPGRVIPQQVRMEDGSARLVFPRGVSKFWVEPHLAVVRGPGGSRHLGAAILGPFTPSASVLKIVMEGGRLVRGKVRCSQQELLGLEMFALAKPWRRPHYQKAFPWWGGRLHAYAKVHEDGAYVLEGLGDLKYVLEFTVPMEWATPDPVVLPTLNGMDTKVEAVTLVRAVSGHIRVQEESGTPLPSAWLRIYYRGPDGISRDIRTEEPLVPFQLTDDSGLADVPGLHPQRVYSILATVPSREDLDAYRRVTHWVPSSEPKVIVFKKR